LKDASGEAPKVGYIKRFLLWIQKRDIRHDPLVETSANSDGACYFGEFPLSFAASIGSVDICQMLWDESRLRMKT